MRTSSRFRSGTGVRVEIALLVVAVILLVALVPRVQVLEREGLAQLSALGHWAPVVLIAGYSVAAALLLPAFPLDFAAGAHFDFWLGVLWVQVAATVASITGHFLGATVLRGTIDRFLLGRPKLRRLREAVQEEGWRMVFLTRLSPVFSFSLLNFVFGAARVPLRPYVAATFVGMLPGTALYVYAGTLAGNLSGTPDNPPRPLWHWVAQALGFLATIALVVYVTRRAQRALRERIEA